MICDFCIKKYCKYYKEEHLYCKSLLCRFLRMICFQRQTTKHYAGLKYIKQKKYEKAVKEFLKIVKQDEKFPNAYYNLALSYQMLNNFDEAIKYYLKSIELAQNEYDSYYNIGVIFLNQKDYKKAKENFKKASEADAEQALAKFYMVYCDDQLSDYYTNEELAEKIINEYLSFEKYKNKIEHYYSIIATVYAKIGNLKESKKYCELALDENLSDIQCYRLLGIIYMLENDLEEAEYFINIGKELESEDKDIIEISKYMIKYKRERGL